MVAELERTVGEAPALTGEIVEIRHLDDREAPRREVSPDPLEGGDRSPQVLQHVGHRDQVKANAEVRDSLDVSAVDPVASRDRVGGGRRALDPLRAVPELAQGVEEEPGVAADVERPRARVGPADPAVAESVVEVDACPLAGDPRARSSDRGRGRSLTAIAGCSRVVLSAELRRRRARGREGEAAALAPTDAHPRRTDRVELPRQRRVTLTEGATLSRDQSRHRPHYSRRSAAAGHRPRSARSPIRPGARRERS